MNEFIENFHFLRPLWLLTLIIPVVFYLKYFKGSKNKSSWEKICDKNLLNFLLIRGSSKIRKKLGYLSMIGLISTIIAIAGPTWKKEETPNIKPENPVMILLNLSTDMQETDIKPSRLKAAKYKISDFLKDIKQAEAGLIVYTNEPFLITPITEDINVIINLLPSIETDIMPSNGDRLDRAINLVIENMKNAGFRTGNILLFTADSSQKLDLVIQAAKLAENSGYKLNIINMSSENNEKLEHIAKVSNGTYAQYNVNDSDIDNISNAMNQEMSNLLKKSENMSSLWVEYGYFLCIIPLLCCLYFFRRGILVLTFIVGFSQTAHASFFENDNQQALRYYKSGRYEKAAQTFNDPKWLGATYYRQGEFEKSYQEFSKDNSITGLYNQGNALAKSGKIDDAIKKYEEVLEKKPTHEQAKFNLEYLKKQKEQQQQNQQSSQQENEKDENKNDQKQDGQNQQNQQNKEQNSGNENQNKESQNQNQNAEQNQKKEENKQQKNSENQQGMDSQKQEQKSSEDKDKNKEEQQQAQSSQEQSKQKNDSEKDVKQNAAEAKVKKDNTKDEKEDWSEERQAREQQYRNIPENPGGLLRAFINKEYNKNRYNE
ncbi:MAG: tetratricopeptide repeat protein [Alphaproteobacteria bacterium]